MTTCERCVDHGLVTVIPDGARWCDSCACEDDEPDYDLSDVTPDEWRALEDELDALARTDPAVARAAENYHQMARRIGRLKDDTND